MRLPLSYGERGVHDADGEPVSLSVRDVARRVVAAVNACDGIETEKLERLAAGSLAGLLAQFWPETLSSGQEHSHDALT